MNSSANTVYLVGAYVANASNSIVQNPNFPDVGLCQQCDSAAGRFGGVGCPVRSAHQRINNAATFRRLFKLCKAAHPGSSTAPCSTQIANVSTLSGTATGANLILSYLLSGGVVYLQPSNPTPVQFRERVAGRFRVHHFHLVNQCIAKRTGSGAFGELQPAILFQLDTSALPTSIAATSAVTFKVSFAPIRLEYSMPP